MNCDRRCGEIGGPWIDFDPNCPVHGYAAQQEEKERDRRRQKLLMMIHSAVDIVDIKEILREMIE